MASSVSEQALSVSKRNLKRSKPIDAPSSVKRWKHVKASFLVSILFTCTCSSNGTLRSNLVPNVEPTDDAMRMMSRGPLQPLIGGAALSATPGEAVLGMLTFKGPNPTSLYLYRGRTAGVGEGAGAGTSASELELETCLIGLLDALVGGAFPVTGPPGAVA